MTRKYVKSGRPRKPYTYKKPLAERKVRKPGRVEAYCEALVRLQTYEAVGQEFGVTGAAVRVALRRAGVEVTTITTVTTK